MEIVSRHFNVVCITAAAQRIYASRTDGVRDAICICMYITFYRFGAGSATFRVRMSMECVRVGKAQNRGIKLLWFRWDAPYRAVGVLYIYDAAAKWYFNVASALVGLWGADMRE